MKATIITYTDVRPLGRHFKSC